MFDKSKKSLKIVIVGCGKVGATLVEQLSKEDNDITIIDKNSKKIQEIGNTYDIMAINGNGASYSTQLEAGVNQCDLFIAVTDSDELNLLCCTVAKHAGKCATIARVRTPDYSKETSFIRDQLGLQMIINPELEAAKEMARILYLPTALEVNSFAQGRAEIVKFKIPEGNLLNNMKVNYLGRYITNDILICGVERDGEVFIPNGEFTMKSGDIVSIVAQRKVIRKFLEDIGFNTHQVKSCMIIGGGKASFYLASQLLNMGIAVKIIESDLARCEELATLLPKAIIINGDGTDEELLKEEGIETIESFVPLTGIDEENILLTLYAKRVSEAKVITKITRGAFKDVISGLDLGSVVYPRYITSEAIIAYARAKKDSLGSNIETLYHMFDHRVEAIEFRVGASSAVTGTPLKDLKLRKNLLIACITRKGNVIIPSGNDTIEPNDSVIIVTTHTGFQDIQDILPERD